MTNNDWINQSKGIAIILVVLGHTILGFQSSNMFSEYNNFFDYMIFTIYSFHMPLFFIISGYIYFKFEKINNNTEYKSLIKKKALNLLIPYFVFCSIQLLIKSILGGSTNSGSSINDIFLLPLIPREQFWFLYTLFVIFVILTFIDMKLNNKVMLLASLIIINILEIHMDNVIFAITSFCVYAIYFYIGILFAKGYINKNVDLKNKYNILRIVLLYTILNVFIYNSNIDINIERLLSLILALFGSFMIIGITKSKLNNKYIDIIGKYSYEIFLLHTIFGAGIRIVLVKVFKVYSIGLHFALGLIFSIVIPIVIAKISKNFKPIDFLFKPSRYIKNYQKLKKSTIA